MANDNFESLAGLRKQVIENCYFFQPIYGDISLIIAHEPIGTYKAIVVSETSHRRNVMLSSDSFENVTKALEHLFIKSTDAVQQFITANDFRRLPSVAKVDDDDAISSVSSYVDEPDKDRLAGSSVSLDSELESAYVSPIEDGDGPIGHSSVRTGGRPQVYDIRTARRDSRSLSRSRSRDHAPAYRKAPVPPASFAVHRSEAADPPRPYAGPNGFRDFGNVRFPAVPSQMPPVPPMPPMPGQGFMAHCVDLNSSSDPHHGHAHVNGSSMPSHQQRLGAIQQHREEVKRFFGEGQRNGPGLIDLDGKAVSQPSLPPSTMLPLRSGHSLQPGPWQQLYMDNEPRSFVAPLVAARPQPTFHGQPLPPHKTPVKNSSSPMMPSSASSTASSSASSTPTITVDPRTLPEFSSSAWSPVTIDYRLVIKTPFPSALDAVAGYQEHRIIARTPPTRSDMSALAIRYIQQQNLPYVRSMSTRSLRAMVTRAVFSAGQGREESYDLSAYPEHDFSQLCEVMKRAGKDEERVGLPQVNGWPIFEVVVCNSGS